MIKIGVMGCGVVADYGHIPAIQQTPGMELVALFDPVFGRVEETAGKFGIPGVFTDQEAFLDSGLDAVVVTSPAWAHRDNVLAAAERNLHVLCEKPIAMDDAGAHGMISAMASTGKIFGVGYVYRFSPVAMQIRNWIREGIIGEVRAMRLVYIWDLHGQWEEVGGDWIESPRWKGRMLEGGPMVDCGVHQIDLARWWLGEEIVHYSAAGAWVAEYEAPDHVWLHLDHEKGCHTAVEMSFSYGHTAKDPGPLFTYDIIGTGGTIRYDRNGWVFELRNGRETRQVPGGSEKNFAGLHSAFASAIQSGNPADLPTGLDGLIATKIARTATERLISDRHRRNSGTR